MGRCSSYKVISNKAELACLLSNEKNMLHFEQFKIFQKYFSTRGKGVNQQSNEGIHLKKNEKENEKVISKQQFN